MAATEAPGGTGVASARAPAQPLVIVDLEARDDQVHADRVARSIHARTAPALPVARVGTQDAWPEAAGIVVTGSGAMVGEVEWARPLANRLEGAARAGTPVLGICFGHQLLGVQFGGRLASWAAVRHGTAPVRFHGGPWRDLEAVLAFSHRDRLVDAGRLSVVARGGLDDGRAIAAVVHPELPLYGVQGHPEATPETCRALDHDAAWDGPYARDGARVLAAFGDRVAARAARQGQTG